MKQTTKRFLSMIISFVFFSATLVIYFNLIVPANAEEQEIKARAISRQEFVDSQKAAISQVQKLINSYKGEGELQDVVSSIIPYSPDTAGAFTQINGLAQVNKLSVQNILVSTPQTVSVPQQGGGFSGLAKPYGYVDFEIRIAGTYGDFKAFLGNLETNIRIFDVKKISIQQSGGKPNQDNYIYNVVITAYYQSS